MNRFFYHAVIPISAALIGAATSYYGVRIEVLPAPPPTEHQIISSAEYRSVVEESSRRFIELEQAKDELVSLRRKISDARAGNDGAAATSREAINMRPASASGKAPVAGLWKGSSVEGNGYISMVMQLNQARPGEIDGFVNIPEQGNVVLKVQGRLVTEVEDFVDRTRWENLRLPDDLGVFFSMRTLSVVQSSHSNNLPRTGVYKCLLEDDQTMKVVMFWRKDDAKPAHILQLARSE